MTMKKLYMLLLAMLTYVTAFAQNNLAAAEGVKAYASSVSDENATFVADNVLTPEGKWASNYGTQDASMTDEQKSAQWLYIDLGAAAEFNTVKISWDNQAARLFDLRVADADPAADPKTAGQLAMGALTGTDNQTNSYQLPAAVSARYLIVDLQERGPWGYGITQIELYNIDYANAKIVKATVTPAFFAVGTPGEFSAKAFDEYNNEKEGVQFTVAGNAFTSPYTFNAAGIIPVTATLDGATATTNVYALGEDEALSIPADAAYTFYGPETENIWLTAWNGGVASEQDLMVGSWHIKAFGGMKCFFLSPAGKTEENDWNNMGINPVREQWGEMHIIVYSPKAGQQVNVNFSDTDPHAVVLEKEGWNNVAVDLTGVTNIQNLSLRSAEGFDMALAAIYFTKAAENPDAGKVVKATVSPAIVATGVATTLTINAFDNKGVEIDAEALTVTLEGLVDGAFTAQEAGEYTVKVATNGGAEVVEATVLAVAPAAQTAENDDIVLFNGKASEAKVGFDAGSQGWDGGFTHQDNLVFADGTEAFYATDVKKFYMTAPAGVTAADLTGYTCLHLDVYSTVDKANALVNIEGMNVQKEVSLKAGQWNSVEVPFEAATANPSWIWVRLAEPAEDFTGTLLVSNVYFSKKTATGINTATVAAPALQGKVYTIGGAEVAPGSQLKGGIYIINGKKVLVK